MTSFVVHRVKEAANAIGDLAWSVKLDSYCRSIGDRGTALGPFNCCYDARMEAPDPG